jgi:hypothetical protein
MFRRFFLTVALSAVVACSGPPTKEREQADAALATARGADAADYAPEELAAAETALGQYDAAVAQRDYRQALRLALEARDSAYEASKRAATEKSAAEARANELIRTVQTLSRTLNTRPAVGTPRPAERSRAAVKAADTALQEARASMTQHNYRAAIETLAPIADSLRRELEIPAPAKRGR